MCSNIGGCSGDVSSFGSRATGEIYSFRNSRTCLLDEPDPVQAHKWYSVAVEQNVAGAEEKLQALRGGMEAAAQAGDMSAQRLLLNWK